MNSRRTFRSTFLFTALAFVAAMHAPNALAALLVSGTTASGNIGSTANPTFTIDTTAADFSTSEVGAWDFRLSWNPLALDFDPAASSIVVNGVSRTLSGFLSFLEGLDTDFDPLTDVTANLDQGAGTYQFSWLDLSLDPAKLLDIGSAADSVVFTGAFLIEAGATPGASYDIALAAAGNDSLISDTYLDSNSYGLANPAMRVTVNQPQTAIPEPGTFGLLLGGLAAAYTATRLRRKQ